MSFCFLGDTGNNMGDSLLIGGAKMGMDGCASAAKGKLARIQRSSPARQIDYRRYRRQTAADRDVQAGVSGADFLYTDVWLSMGEPEETSGPSASHHAALPE